RIGIEKNIDDHLIFVFFVDPYEGQTVYYDSKTEVNTAIHKFLSLKRQYNVNYRFRQMMPLSDDLLTFADPVKLEYHWNDGLPEQEREKLAQAVASHLDNFLEDWKFKK
ncbi:MAG: hypothetical protein AAGM67_16510, partial [Bacteroidota bacterium]